MTIIIVILLIAIIVATGILWGKSSIKKDTVHKSHENKVLDKLHKLM